MTAKKPPADDLTLEYMPVDELVSAERNAKGHDEPMVAASMHRYGYAEPIVLDERTGKIVAGHGRRDVVLDMQQRDETTVPRGVRIVDGRWLVPVVRGWRSENDDEAIAAGIDFNRTSEAGGWNWQALLPDLERLDTLEAGLPLGFTGDELGDLRNMIGNLADLPSERRTQGEPGERDFWPVLRLQVSADTKQRWDQYVRSENTDDTDKLIAQLLDKLVFK